MRYLPLAVLALLTALATALPDPLPQGYTGPCSKNECGADRKICPRGYLCVPTPHPDLDKRKGCSCSYGL
jgi:hypothetical protein